MKRANCIMLMALVCIFLIAQSGLTANKISSGNFNKTPRPEKTEFHAKYGTAEIVSGRFEVTTGVTMKDKAHAFISARNQSFKIAQPENELKLISENSDKFGFSHLRFQQKYDGLRVWGCQTIVHFEDDQTIYLVGGQTIPTPSINTNPSIDSDDAAESAIAVMDQEVRAFELETESELIIYPNDGDPKLAYLVTVVSRENLSILWRIFVDAENGEIIHKYNDLQYDYPLTAEGYNVKSEWVSFPAYRFEDSVDQYQMVNTENTGFIRTFYDWFTMDPDSLCSSSDNDSLWDDYESHKAEVSAHDYTGQTYDYFMTYFARDSYDGMGHEVIVNTHPSSESDNAWWNSYWQVMSYGDGAPPDTRAYSAGIDVVAHEFMHAVTWSTAGLIYQNQSGALNESYSDVFGHALDPDDWQIGEEVRLTAPGYFRSMEHPMIVDDPEHMSDYRYMPLWEDNGGVHTNSGIINHAFYQAVEVEGLLRDEAEYIWYKTLQLYLTPNSGFNFWACMLKNTATNIFAPTSTQEIAIINALRTVGLGQLYAMDQELIFNFTEADDFISDTISLYNNNEDGMIPIYNSESDFDITVLFESSYEDSTVAIFECARPTGICGLGVYNSEIMLAMIIPNDTIYIPVTVTVGIDTYTEYGVVGNTPCMNFSASNTTSMYDLDYPPIDTNLLYDASLLVGLVDGDDTLVYRNFSSAESFVPVKTISTSPGMIETQFCSNDGRIQGKVTYTFPTSNPDTCEFIIAEYAITNPCDTALEIITGVIYDFDIHDYENNIVPPHTADINMLYMDDFSVKCGLLYLEGGEYATIKNIWAVHNPTYVWDNKFSDEVAYKMLNSSSLVSGMTPSDYSLLMSFEKTTLGENDTLKYKMAIFYTDLPDIELSTLTDKIKAWGNISPKIDNVEGEPNSTYWGSAYAGAYFHDAIDLSTFGNNTFTIQGGLTGIPDGVYTNYGNTMLMYEYDDGWDAYFPGELVMATLTNGLVSSYGVPLEPGFSWSYNIAVDSGSGNFGTAVDYATGDNPRGITGADFDQDSDIDLFVANRSAGTITFYFNDGSGNFTVIESAPLPGIGPTAITSGDFNRDGMMDLAWANLSSNNIGVSLAMNPGVLGPIVYYPTGAGTYDVVARDFNSDGWLDIATANIGDGSYSILLNNGDGTFPTHTEYTTMNLGGAGGEPWDIASGDLDNDGDFDLILVIPYTSFPDIGTIAISLNNGDGTFGDHNPLFTGTPGDPIHCALADINGDYYLDMVVACPAHNAVFSFINTANDSIFYVPTALYPVDSMPMKVDLADFNADGHMDIVTINSGSANVSVLLNNGDGTFGESSEYASGSWCRSMFTADLDNNGSIDIAAGSTMDSLYILFNENALPVTCGDADDSKAINLLDVTHLINYLYKGGPPPTPYACAGDANMTINVNILDATHLINYLYKGGPPPIDGCCTPVW